ncbi:hypothetical protein SEA_REYNAULD_63 [Rhodococcus phage Reynauld]|uniref:Uncharacterized protein n=1 Tax=Rhodococcus phage Reynauld TaxID=3062845 RepID=A0ACD4UKV0_9CAUD|nr:hypothetical protein SEA_REYNAULD_63 [Rhodococcus phage Reynauld]
MVDRDWHITYTEIRYTGSKGTSKAYLCQDCPHAHSSIGRHEYHFHRNHPSRKPPWSPELAELDLSIGLHYALVQDRIYTPEDLAARHPNDLYDIRGIGVTRHSQIYDALCRYYGYEPRDQEKA